MKAAIKQGNYFKFQLCYSPDENIYYFQRTDTWQVSKKSYKTEEEAMRDYASLNEDYAYQWE